MDAELVRETFDYDPETGVFRWRKKIGSRAVAGAVAEGRDPNGYIRIKAFGRCYFAHRLAWLYVHGVWPVGFIDHINRITDDNRLVNLRQANHWQNAVNIKNNCLNTSGVKGVNWHAGMQKWCARIRINGLRITLGYFDTKELAAAAYQDASLKHHGEYSIFHDRTQQVTP